MAVHLHRAHRTDALADELARLLAEPADDPFAEEVVVVPARGVERWLTQRLSHRLGGSPGGDDGVCAGVRFLSPRSLVALLTGTERTDPWDPDRLVWPLLATIDDVLTEPWARTLAAHLGADDDAPAASHRRDRRWSVARRLSGLLARYATQRPGMLADWRAGRDTDGERPVADDLTWQPELYRRLLERTGLTPPDVRHTEVLAAIRGGAPLALPDRLSLFGHTRLPVTEVELLAAVGEVREVHLWLPQASAVAWDALRPAVAEGAVRRSEDSSTAVVGHPLLSSLGRDARELQRSLIGVGAATDEAVAEDLGEPTTLLGWLQHDLRAAAEPDEARRAARALRADDDSVQLHACHGPTRQVDVLREVLVGLLQDDPTLEPRDVLVMCPDIEAYAPLLEAGFGLADRHGQGHPAHGLRVRLADRGLARTNPLLDLAARVVAIAGGRATAGEVLDLASADVVRRRFGLSDDDLAQLATWVTDTQTRWGLDAGLRAPYGLGDVPHNTWSLGLDRLLAGVAMAEQGGRRFAEVLPLDDVGSAAIELAGRLSELVERLETAVRALLAARTGGEWAEALTDAVAALGDVPPSDAWQRPQAERELRALADDAGASAVPLSLADVRILLAQRLEGRASRASFRTGALTVATMVPMRSVPHRVVALVGLDDGAFPRTPGLDGDDVLARDPRTGERDLRSEDRQLLLDAVMAATERLVLTYSGADELRGGTRPPAVPVGELLDALDATTSAPVRDRVRTAHPLQPFDGRNFRVDAEGTGREGQPFSFDRAAHAGAVAAAAPRRLPEPFLRGVLPPAPDAGGDVALADLQHFLAHPVRAFVQRRLQISLPWEEDEPSDAIPVELDNLQEWGVADRVLRAAASGEVDLEDALRAELSRGVIPPRRLGLPLVDDLRDRVAPLLAATEAERAVTAETVDVVAVVRDDSGVERRVTGQVPGVRGDQALRLQAGSIGARHRLAAWVELLVLTVAQPDRSWTVRVVGKGGSRPRQSLFGPVPAAEARVWLAALLDVRDRGMREPLPLPLKTGLAWAESPHDREGALRAWETDRFSPERADGYHELVWGPALPFEPDENAPPQERRGLLGPAEADEMWATGPSERLGQYALRVWGPALEHESRGVA